MNPSAIFLPLFALMGWTFLVLLLIPYRRFKAVFAGQVTAGDFRLGESNRVPDEVKMPNRMFMNLLEMPVLFYVLTIIIYVTGNVDPNCIVLSWSYVGLRVLHSLIALTYNHVFHRFLAFALSNVVILILWLKLSSAFLK